eukprot:7194454-Lingulodinium_polyedra.AAC.1
MARGADSVEQTRMRTVRWRDPATVAEEIGRVEASLREEQARARQDRGQRWYRWVQDAMAGGGGRLYRWIKAGAPAVPTLVHDPADPEQADDGVR